MLPGTLPSDSAPSERPRAKVVEAIVGPGTVERSAVCRSHSSVGSMCNWNSARARRSTKHHDGHLLPCDVSPWRGRCGEDEHGADLKASWGQKWGQTRIAGLPESDYSLISLKNFGDPDFHQLEPTDQLASASRCAEASGIERPEPSDRNTGLSVAAALSSARNLFQAFEQDEVAQGLLSAENERRAIARPGDASWTHFARKLDQLSERL